MFKNFRLGGAGGSINGVSFGWNQVDAPTTQIHFDGAWKKLQTKNVGQGAIAWVATDLALNDIVGG